MPNFTYYFLDGTKRVLPGSSPHDALNKAGFGSGALRTLDFFETEKQAASSDYAWNPQKRKWESARIIAQARADFHGADLDPSKPTSVTTVGNTVVAVSQKTDISQRGRNSPSAHWKSVDESKVPTSLPPRPRRSPDAGKLRREVVTVYSILPRRRNDKLIYELDLGGRKVRSDTEGTQRLNRMGPSRSGQRMCLWFNNRGTVSGWSKA